MKRLLMLISVALCCASTVAQKPIEVTDTEVEQHRISSQRFLPIKQDNSWRPYVKLEITVGPDGRVMSAEPQEGDAHYYAAAVHAALDWTYKPFARNGHAISVNFSEYVRVVPPERRPTQHVPFPEIKDWNSLRITLERTGCFGSCPTYALELRGNGAVQYVGGEFVKYCGEWRGEVPVSSVRDLVAQFRGTDYFSLFPNTQRG